MPDIQKRESLLGPEWQRRRWIAWTATIIVLVLVLSIEGAARERIRLDMSMAIRSYFPEICIKFSSIHVFHGHTVDFVANHEAWFLLAGALTVVGTLLFFQRLTRKWQRAAPLLVVALAIPSIVYLITLGLWVLVYIEGIHVLR